MRARRRTTSGCRGLYGLRYDVVLDWNQWSRARRSRWRDTARQAGCPVVLHHVDVPVEVAVARALGRTDTAGAHHIDEAGVRHLAGIFEPPTADEGIPIRTVR